MLAICLHKSEYWIVYIPIIIVYTQAVDVDFINEMKKDIKNNNIKGSFIKVLAERKKLINGQFLEAFGLDDLLKKL